MSLPLVSICCVTYNHKDFIRQCLDGFLMQQGVEYEILIHDDCSTDGTTEIVREYAEKYPDKIFPLYEDVNQYQNGKASEIDFYNYRRARGKYIAYCEGDDYWTDPLKLQKQVEWMESHPEYSICFTGFINRVVSTNEYLDSEANRILRCYNISTGLDIDVELYFKTWCTQPLTMLFRKDALDMSWCMLYDNYRDTHEIYHLLKVGKCRLLNCVTGVRNVHNGGVSSMISTIKSCSTEWANVLEIYSVNKYDNSVKKHLINVIMWNYDCYNEQGLMKEFWRQWIDYYAYCPWLSLFILYKILKIKIKQVHRSKNDKETIH